MAECQSCGSELTGAYCNTCGARAPEERTPKKVKRETAPAHGTAKVSHAPASRGHGALSSQRIWRTTAVAIMGLLLYGAGIFTGVYMAQGDQSTAPAGDAQTVTVEGEVDVAGMPPLARANFYMENGVALMNEGQRSAAISEFRKSITEWQNALKAEPDNLYAETYLGLTYYYAGDSNKALDTLRGVLEKDSNYLWAIFNLAWIYQAGEKPDQALLMYQRYLAAAPTEKQNMLKYAEQFELIDRQITAAEEAVAKLSGGGTGK